ncbi:hypothetical protein CYMTET_4329 [Cymbomonas tetramitiformis]|uniref:Dynein axonemal intermediate chain 4 n=1 Tax=Cymbomonas tetramitiformis TaxID=36881 RepID=A0AAE0H1L1_9CHLO|nr:hypothetical protein CYMTET_4329 [Cymbomonas tetramitiformis]
MDSSSHSKLGTVREKRSKPAGAGTTTSTVGRGTKAAAANDSRRISRASGKEPSSKTKNTQSSVGDKENAAGHTQVQVFDEKGLDVTPKPLLSLKPTVLGAGGGAQKTPGHSTPTSERESLVSDAIDRISSAGFSRSGYSQDGSTGSVSPSENEDETETSTPDAEDTKGEPAEEKEGKEGKKKKKEHKEHKAEVYEHVEAPLTEQELEKNVYILLKETETFWLLNIPGRCVANDSPEAAAVEEANERYRTLLKDKEGSEMFVEVATQTLNTLYKNREIQTQVEGVSGTGCQATGWDIIDSFAEEAVAEGGEDALGPTTSVKDPKKDKEKELAQGEEADDEGKEKNPLEASLNNFDGLTNALTIMERAVTQNIYHDRLLLYRNFRARNPKYAAPEGTQAMQHLWDFTCDLTKDRNVSCMVWNKMKKDMLAVGYGQFEFSKQKDGMVAFWSLKNPDYPDWVFRAPCGVTSLDFSKQQPSLLAVGFYDGMVAIYDVRAPTDKPILETGHTSGKHSDPVWKLQWVERGSERGEVLISISTDGRVTQWSIKKGLECQDLMLLKRVHRRTMPTNTASTKNTKTEAFISRRSSGMCFDFSPKDPSIYVTGTEDGNIHKCSCSYSEQYLESYFGHSGPLYQIQWSPFAHNLFLSASADWSVKLWQEDSDTALITFQSGNEEVADLQWSPTNSTVFGTVTCDGRLEVWDLSVSTLKPILAHTLEENKLSCLLFSEASPIVVCGGSNGSVSVFRLVGVDRPDDTSEEQLRRLEDAMSSNIMSTSEESKS